MVEKRLNARQKRLLILEKQEEIKKEWNNKIQNIVDNLPKDLSTNNNSIMQKAVYKLPQLRKALNTIEQEKLIKNI